MQRYLIRRAISGVIVLAIISVLTFGALNVLPGDALVIFFDAESGGLDPEQKEAVRKALGLDQPVPVRYLNWLGGIVRGDLGTSLLTRQPVGEALLERLPATVQLALLAWLFGMLIAFPAGILAASRPGTGWDLGATVWAVSGVAAPNFWLGIILIVIFGVNLRWLPPVGFVSILEDPIGGLRASILPAVTLGTGLAAVMMRQIRSGLLEVWRMDYITTARSKGLRERRILRVHALRNALLPLLTILGLQVANLLGGAVIVERLYAWPGLGRLALSAIFSFDYPVVMATVMFAAVVVVLANLAVDVLYAVVDPRIRYT
jgi:peptide/nickel transport system permease protein